jgi:hypothetical protein
MNKHGYLGVRKRTSPQHWRKPYYARVSDGCERFRYSRNYATAEEAAAAYWELKGLRAAAGRAVLVQVEG